MRGRGESFQMENLATSHAVNTELLHSANLNFTGSPIITDVKKLLVSQ